MKKYLFYLIAVFSIFMLFSCSYDYMNESMMDDYYHTNENVTIDVVITSGIPYYYNGYLSYYYYHNMYYYPLYYNGYWWWRPYRKAFVHGYMPRWIPNKHDMHFRPGHYGFDVPRENFRGTPSKRIIDNARNHVRPHDNVSNHVRPHDNARNHVRPRNTYTPNNRHNDRTFDINSRSTRNRPAYNRSTQPRNRTIQRNNVHNRQINRRSNK